MNADKKKVEFVLQSIDTEEYLEQGVFTEGNLNKEKMVRAYGSLVRSSGNLSEWDTDRRMNRFRLLFTLGEIWDCATREERDEMLAGNILWGEAWDAKNRCKRKCLCTAGNGGMDIEVAINVLLCTLYR